jgi:hypothetical protein
MDIFTFIAGLLAAFVVFGHFIMGIKWYLTPMMKSDFDLVPKATMQSAFHYVSVYLLLSAAALIISGLKIFPGTETYLLVKFIGLNYLTFTLVQIFYSVKNKVKKPLVTMFQWTLFLPIGILCLL